MTFELRSPAVPAEGTIPIEHTCEGADRSPPLEWSGAPAGTRSFALLVHDPDAPRGDWVHWVLYDLPATSASLPAGVPTARELEGGARQGRNDFDRIGWGGPCPPPGRAHRYVFVLHAVDRMLGLAPGASREEMEHALRGHVLERAALSASYARRARR
jgi:Raf kinase inhibitor-like YbhB/YbcL family protein